MTGFNVQTAQTEERKDNLGGGFSVDPTGIYNADIVAIYLHETTNSKAATVIYKMNGKEQTETLYYANKEGQVYTERDGKKFDRIGWLHLQDILKLGAGVDHTQYTLAQKDLQIWNREAGKKVVTKVPVIEQSIGIKVNFAMEKVQKPKQVKVGNEYRDTTQMIDRLELVKVLTTDNFTNLEKSSGATEKTFFNKWVEERPEDHVRVVAPKNPVQATTQSSGGAPAMPSSDDPSLDL